MAPVFAELASGLGMSQAVRENNQVTTAISEDNDLPEVWTENALLCINWAAFLRVLRLSITFT